MSSSDRGETYTYPYSPPSTTPASAGSQTGTATSTRRPPLLGFFSRQTHQDRSVIKTNAIDSLVKLRDASVDYGKIRHQLDSGSIGHITPGFEGIIKEHEEKEEALRSAQAEFIHIHSQLDCKSDKRAVLQEAKDEHGVTNAQELWNDADANNSLQSQSHNGV